MSFPVLTRFPPPFLEERGRGCFISQLRANGDREVKGPVGDQRNRSEEGKGSPEDFLSFWQLSSAAFKVCVTATPPPHRRVPQRVLNRQAPSEVSAMGQPAGHTSSPHP